jgi:hypothetical protein
VLVLWLLTNADVGTAASTAVDTKGWADPPLIAADAPAAEAPEALQSPEMPSPRAQVAVAPVVVPGAPAPDAEVQSEVAPKSPGSTHFGALLDAGLPDGGGISVVFRPWYFLRVHAGVANNLFSTGFRGGVTVVPFNFWITPSLTVEGGYLPPGDANNAVRMVSGDPSFNSAALKDISYGFGSAHLGLEVGPPRRFTFCLRAGLSYLDGNLGGLQTMLQQSDQTVQSKPLHVRMTLPSAKLGFSIYFL